MNGPKVQIAALEKSDQMLETLDASSGSRKRTPIFLVWLREKIREVVFPQWKCQTISRKDRSTRNG
jgi:hypothetical protein